MAAPTDGVRQIRPRQPMPSVRFNQAAALATTALAVAAYVWAVAVGQLPSTASSIVLFAATPLCAIVALPVLVARAWAERDLAVGWVAAGVAAAVLALALQLISYPTVAAGGGPLRTNDQSSAGLYLLFHAWFYFAAILGGARLTGWLIAPFAMAAAIFTVVVAANGVPLSGLMGPGQTFTAVLRPVEYATAAVAVATVWVWVRASGAAESTRLRGWIGVSLSVSAYEVFLNAQAGGRFDHLWWASLSLRAIGFAVLAFGSVGYLLGQLKLVERYSNLELERREAELRGSLGTMEQLLINARELGRARSPVEVATALGSALRSAWATAAVEVYGHDPVTARLLRVGDAPGPAKAGGLPMPIAGVALDGVRAGDAEASFAEPVFTDGEPALTGAPTPATAQLLLRARGVPVGVMAVSLRHGHLWTPTERALVEGLAAQAGPALARAVLGEREHAAAETLQRSLLPERLPEVPGVSLAARYRPAVESDHVGGDWYDSWRLPDGRLVLVVGDVVGKGVGAAATMGRLRASVRALATADPEPSQVISQLTLMETGNNPGMVATVVYAVLDLAERSLRMANAGHLPILVSTSPGSAELVGYASRPPIGVSDQPVPEQVTTISDDTLVLMFTDGLVEDRQRDLDSCLAELRRTVVSARQRDLGPDALAAELVGRAPRADDLALLIASTVPL